MAPPASAELKKRDLGWVQFFSRVRKLHKLYVRVGVIADSEKGEEKAGGRRGGITLAALAAILELGTEDKRIPGRSYLRATFDAERDHLIEMTAELVEDVLDGKRTNEQALGLVGAYLVSAIKKRIRDGIPPPNAPSTIERKVRKGRTRRFFKKAAATLGDAFAQAGAAAAVKPLIDTAHFINAITWAVGKRGGVEGAKLGDEAVGGGGEEQDEG